MSSNSIIFVKDSKPCILILRFVTLLLDSRTGVRYCYLLARALIAVARSEEILRVR